jgi:CheY-like chemotaxis protein
MMLHGGNPFELCGRLRQQFPQLPIILLSERPNGIQPVEQRWAVGRGATDLIAKNLDDPEPLLLRVNQLARNLSAVNHEALTSARTALQQPKPNLPIAAPQLIQRPKNGLLQSLINALQSAAAPPDEAAPKSVRYRGTNVPNKE